jgi:1-pyrroline-5-carboxylate dehydrogenase
MHFENVNTHYRMLREGQEGTYHSRYEAEVEAMAEQLRSLPEYNAIVEGKRVPGRSYFEDVSPISSDIVLGRFGRGSQEDVGRAVDAAERAFQTWSRTDLTERLRIFARAADLMEKDLFRLAAVLTYDNGKDREEAIAEVDEAIDFIRFYVKAMQDNHGFEEETLRPYEDERARSVLRPYGVWGVVCPFNFPLAISCGMITGAIITGNTVVAKPASPAPLSVFHLYDIYERAGLPPGVINVVTGSGAEVGDTLVNHPKVSGVVFTGSKDVGYRLIRESLTRFPRPVIAEMGGKNAAIVSQAADMAKAVKGVAQAAFGFSGQKCSACSRVYVHEQIFDIFVEMLAAWSSRFPIGDPRQRDTFICPVIHPKAVQDYERYVAMAQRDGKVVIGGRRRTENALAKGNYVEPTIVTGLPEDHFLVKNELFLPILCVQRYGTLEEAVRNANDVDFGLTAGIYSNLAEEVRYFFDHIEAGVCYANRARSATTGAMVGAQPFGGWKASGSTGKGSGTALYLTQFMRQQARTNQV